MTQGSNQQNTRIHNTVVAVMTVASVGTIIESLSQGWEYWVPPLIFAGIVAAWILHLLQYGQRTFRENYYLVFSMLLAFYHGVHDTSTFDIEVVSIMLMITVTLLRRSGYLNILLVEFFLLFIMQVARSMAFPDVKASIFVVVRESV